jgi:hypothetical protein
LGWGIHFERFNCDSTDCGFADNLTYECWLKMLMPLVGTWIKKSCFDLSIAIDSRYAVGFMEIAGTAG